MSIATLDRELEDTLDLGINLEELRRGVGDQAEHFDRIINLLDALDPSSLPDLVLLNLRNMGLEDQFLARMAESGRERPKTVAYGGPVRWVISHENL